MVVGGGSNRLIEHARYIPPCAARFEVGMAADDPSPVVKYVGHKVSKVQWKPLPSGSIQSSDIFASGSWDDEVGLQQHPHATALEWEGIN